MNQNRYKESEYEKAMRLRIEENRRVMAALFPNGANLKQNLGITTTNSPEKRATPKRRRSSTQLPTRRNPGRKARSYDNCKDDDEDSEDVEKIVYTEDSLIVKWRGPLTKKMFDKPTRLWSDSESDSDSDSPKRKKKSNGRRKSAPRTPMDVREEDLVLVAERVAEKNYDSENGTSCHQCRQKTDDLKTACKSNSCVGIRGQFCGPCLKNRYGEDAKKAIMNPNWVCPPCRGVCNCSFCMKKRGRKATGILIHLAKANGYESVKTFLGD